ncbi:MAG: hypothetical protein J0L73_16085 [Verrucomicrobia bacterium]|nr:hypothetical protein [Verrucomicrobiota bacterium]
MHSRLLTALALVLMLLPAACSLQYGIPERGYGYPAGLSAYAVRLGRTPNYIYYPRYEAYYHPATKMFHYPSGQKWETSPTVLSNSAEEVRASPSVPFVFPDHPSKYHGAVRQSYPHDWTTGKGRYDEDYEFGHSGWDLDQR